MRPLLLGYTVPDEVMAEITAIDPNPPVQTHKFAWALARSLRQGFGEVRLLSTLPVQSYPLVRRLLFRRFAFRSQGVDGVAMGFVNLIVLKHLTRLLACLGFTRRIRGEWGTDVLFMHGVHSPFLLYGWLMSRLGVDVVPVLTDPPGVELATDGRLARLLKRIDRRIVPLLLARASALVALSPVWLELFPGVKKVLVFPGILGRDWLYALATVAPAPRVADAPVTVIYAGGVSAAYGMDRLLDAAARLPQVRFLIFGKGDYVPRITAGGPPNVEYGGFVDARALASHLMAADILINPRPSGQEFARYSFPSKLIEYVATGRPVLTTRLVSIPAEIVPCFHYIDDESGEGVARAIETLVALGTEERLARAGAAREIIMRECSEAAIGRKLAALCGAVPPADE
ncbi:glycosyl transferase group 1 [Ancylobacter novellus DSM 506]|uniref:Glycosyl transferase group 1 n=1 Tax=Ancylobacter novellus (strain ATCC 8093 / DSM 506 / JCM 20403 / CCM 1077 / IAM 12100 / NBRC 12443 / NCIMB 10456) TaxID=639283 RepID=D7A829_ANCN5|nr:glycosyltransferase [Ancylobacter novellus]ADH90487.1 glycosyl transferase group 1 [Ancylobacter novellus DSM 506]